MRCFCKRVRVSATGKRHFKSVSLIESNDFLKYQCSVLLTCLFNFLTLLLTDPSSLVFTFPLICFYSFFPFSSLLSLYFFYYFSIRLFILILLRLFLLLLFDFIFLSLLAHFFTRRSSLTPAPSLFFFLIS
jgi:hypothetical protein